MPDIKSIEAAIELSKDESKLLGVKLGAKTITRGEHIPKAEARDTPELSFDVPSGTYIGVNIDLDAPFPSFPFLGPILHWVQPGLAPTKAADGTTVLSASTTPPIASYIPPGPPPPSAPHRYVFLLYEQPEDFDAMKFMPGGQPMTHFKRIRYDYAAFEKEAKLGPLIASNYFVSN
ncbi:hypothetical protein OIDMADRAFT_105972 [Oidiodendron maius Zn]|uniref:Uncharacterized protein n=1 Tax=Oidiodendron maius (strain Zn) TaxID=913774 RepID=A0A0C3CBU5_OIDMZ|nr:hypothetical protein OIDMADRAFT_105972 [Oidiodendron maius Zn]